MHVYMQLRMTARLHCRYHLSHKPLYYLFYSEDDHYCGYYCFTKRDSPTKLKTVMKSQHKSGYPKMSYFFLLTSLDISFIWVCSNFCCIDNIYIFAANRTEAKKYWNCLCEVLYKSNGVLMGYFTVALEESKCPFC